MDWFWLLQHVIVMYVTFGAYCGYRWCREEGDSVLMSVFVGGFLGGLFWIIVAAFDDDYDVPLPTKNTGSTKAARQENKRLLKIERDETARVEVLERSATHRAVMAQLDERRQKAEEIV